MAYLTEFELKKSNLVDQVTDFWDGVKTGFKERRMNQRTIQELSSLSSRELSDLGIHRSMIKQIALEKTDKA
ncbi:MAG: DUF1127 domain-containing protein [Paracoccaceae bacterium]|nr:DUF1127 domain-containing protein [Paracoccaceae bacterium]